MALHWFQAVFGCSETASYSSNRNMFRLEDGPSGPRTVLHCLANEQSYHIGPFSTPTLEELRQELSQLPAMTATLGRATFRHVHGNVRSFHCDVRNAGAVFQVASQFNCLEMTGPGVSPARGISIYATDPTQGPACAMSCPASTVFRNYFPPPYYETATPSQQINTMSKVETLLKSRYWNMRNGYLLPTDTGRMKALTDLIGHDSSALATQIVNSVAVGVQWNTEVSTASKHCVTQVFASAVPVAYAKSTTSSDWRMLASLVLTSAYQSTLLVAAILARQRQQRVTVYLTMVGGGAFGNRKDWIVQAIQSALAACGDEPIDVCLLHYATVVPQMTERLHVPQTVG